MPDAKPHIRKGMPGVELSREQFAARMRERFRDPAFAPLAKEIDCIVAVAWDAYSDSRKAPRTQKAGPGYADPDYDLSVDWIEASRRIAEAERRQKVGFAPGSGHRSGSAAMSAS